MDHRPLSTDGSVESKSCNGTDVGKSIFRNKSFLFSPSYMEEGVVRRRYLQEVVKSLPDPIQNRITALKNVQLECFQLEAKFHEELFEAHKKYQALYQPLLDKRCEIVTGEIDPPKEEPNWKQEEEEEVEPKFKQEEGELAPKVEIPEEYEESLKNLRRLEDSKGIPNFWYTILKYNEILSKMIHDCDEPVLKKLTDIKLRYNEGLSYTLEFHFDKNEYFSNSVLTKQYYLKSAIDEDAPFSFEGTEIYKCKGCVIDWKKNMNLTVKTIKKKQKHKQHGQVRTVIKQAPNKSFFNFFNPPQSTNDQGEIDEEAQAILATDFEISDYFRFQIIPRAILYYTGDIVDDEDARDEELESEDEELDTKNEGDEYEDEKPNLDEYRI